MEPQFTLGDLVNTGEFTLGDLVNTGETYRAQECVPMC